MPCNQSVFIDRMRAVEDLSVDKAVSVVGGSAGIYERIVRLSARLLPDNIAKLNSLIESNLDSYSIEVHGIKGVLNNIGAYELGMKAYELEDLSKQGDLNACRKLHPSFIDRLTSFFDIIKSAIDDDGCEVQSKRPADMSVIVKALPRLIEAADCCDGAQALDILNGMVGYSFKGDMDTRIAGIKGAFERFNFDEALKLIEKLKEGLSQ